MTSRWLTVTAVVLLVAAEARSRSCLHVRQKRGISIDEFTKAYGIESSNANKQFNPNEAFYSTPLPIQTRTSRRPTELANYQNDLFYNMPSSPYQFPCPYPYPYSNEVSPINKPRPIIIDEVTKPLIIEHFQQPVVIDHYQKPIIISHFTPPTIIDHYETPELIEGTLEPFITLMQEPCIGDLNEPKW